MSFNIRKIIIKLLFFVLIVSVFFNFFFIESLRGRILNGIILFCICAVAFFSFLELKRLHTKRDEFIFIASHKLRTPLTSILGYTSMILEGNYGDISEKIKKIVDNIFLSTQNLTVTVNDFLAEQKNSKEKDDE